MGSEEQVTASLKHCHTFLLGFLFMFLFLVSLLLFFQLCIAVYVSMESGNRRYFMSSDNPPVCRRPGRSPAEILGSNPTEGMDICLL